MPAPDLIPQQRKLPTIILSHEGITRQGHSVC